MRVPSSTSAALVFSAITSCGEESQLFMELAAAFSASEGVRKDTGIISWVRWPNQVTIGGMTVARTAARFETDHGSRSVALSFNVNILRQEIPGEISLYECLGVEVDRDLLLEKMLDSLSWVHFGWSNGMDSRLLRRVRSMTETLNQRVTVRFAGALLSGEALDIDDTGRLLVRLEDGRTVGLTRSDELR